METLHGVHHFYGGMGMAALGYLLLSFGRRRAIVFGLTVTLAGALIMTDDIWQHCLQHVYRDNYASPCKRVYWDLSARWPFLSKTVGAADRIFRGALFDGQPDEPKAHRSGAEQ